PIALLWDEDLAAMPAKVKEFTDALSHVSESLGYIPIELVPQNTLITPSYKLGLKMIERTNADYKVGDEVNDQLQEQYQYELRNVENNQPVLNSTISNFAKKVIDNVFHLANYFSALKLVPKYASTEPVPGEEVNNQLREQ